MKHLLLITGLISNSAFCMDNSAPDHTDKKPKSRPDLSTSGSHQFMHIHDARTGPATPNHSRLKDSADDDFLFAHTHCVSDSILNPQSAKIHMPSREEIKKKNREKTQRLLAQAHQMIKERKDLNSYIYFDWESGKTLLSFAASHKCRQGILQLALDNGADPNQPNEDGTTSLQKATTTYCAANVNYLLSRGAQFDFTGKDKKLLSRVCSPITDEIAPKSTHRKVATIKALIAAGADPNTTDLYLEEVQFASSVLSGLLCHFLAIRKKLQEEMYLIFLDLRKQMISTLLEAGLNPFKKNAAGKTDWENIVDNKSHYDENLFNFAQEQVEKRKL